MKITQYCSHVITFFLALFVISFDHVFCGRMRRASSDLEGASDDLEASYFNMPVWNVSTPLKYTYLPEARFNETEKQIFRRSMAMWTSETCIRYVEVPYSISLRHTIVFNRTTEANIGGYCESQNKTTGMQSIFMHKTTFDKNDTGSVVHELGHSLGLQHEHQRPDRELDVAADLLLTEQKDQLVPPVWGVLDGVPYDVTSIMHYGGDAMAKNNSRELTLSTWDPDQQVIIGNRGLPSFNDYKRINLHYECGKINCQGQRLAQPCQNGGYQDPLKCSHCRCPNGVGGQYCDKLQMSEGFGGTACGGLVEIDSCEAKTLALPTSPGDYPYNAHCTWLVRASSSCNLQYAFEEMPGLHAVSTSITNRCIDYVEVRSNFSRLDKPGKFFCTGSKLAGRKWLTTDNIALVHFRSLPREFHQADIRGRGFLLTFRASCRSDTAMRYPQPTTCKITASGYDSQTSSARYCSPSFTAPTAVDSNSVVRENILLQQTAPSCTIVSTTTLPTTKRATARTTTGWLQKRSENGWTAMHEAAFYGDLETIKTLPSSMLQARANDKDQGRMPIHVAAFNGHLEVVKYFVATLPSLVSSKNLDGEMPIHEAVAGGRTEVVHYFLTSLGMSIEQREDEVSYTLLHMASAVGQLQMFKWLQRRGADVNARDGNGGTVLHTAAKYGQYFVAKHIVERVSGEFLNITDNRGDLPLHIAARFGRTFVLEYFLSMPGSNIDRLSAISQETPLHMASKSGQLEVVKFLVENGANTGQRSGDRNSYMPIHHAAINGRLDVVKYFLEQASLQLITQTTGSGDQPIHLAALNNKTDVIQYLLAKGAAVDARNPRNGRTPLVRALEWGSIAAARLLVSKGANLTAQIDASMTPISFAIASGQLNSVKFLLEEANPNLLTFPNAFGDLPLHVAIRFNQSSIAEYFIVNKQVSVDVRNVRLGRTPLHTAAETGNVTMADFLVKKRANVTALSNAVDHGFMPIHTAAEFDNVEFVKYMVENVSAAQMNLATSQGWLPLHRAAFARSSDALNYLVQVRRQSIDVRDANTNRTALHYASIWGELETAKMLVGRGASLLARDNPPLGSMPIHLAAEFGHLAVVQYFVSLDQGQLTLKTLLGETAERRAQVGKRNEVVNWIQARNG